jgi:hypothetical protein
MIQNYKTLKFAIYTFLNFVTMFDTSCQFKPNPIFRSKSRAYKMLLHSVGKLAALPAEYPMAVSNTPAYFTKSFITDM